MAQDNTGSLVWFIAGAAIGASIALLYAPQSGRDTRRVIVKKTRQGGEALADTGRDLADKGRDLFEKGRRGNVRARPQAGGRLKSVDSLADDWRVPERAFHGLREP